MGRHACCLPANPLSKFPPRQEKPQWTGLGRDLTPRSIQTRNLTVDISATKKLIAVRLRSNGIRSRASRSRAKGIGLQANNSSKLGRVLRTQKLKEA